MKFSRSKIKQIIKEEVRSINEAARHEGQESDLEVVNKNLDSAIAAATELKIELEKNSLVSDRSGEIEDQSRVAATLIRSLLRMVRDEEAIRK